MSLDFFDLGERDPDFVFSGEDEFVTTTEDPQLSLLNHYVAKKCTEAGLRKLDALDDTCTLYSLAVLKHTVPVYENMLFPFEPKHRSFHSSVETGDNDQVYFIKLYLGL